jgi:precorrin-6B methylase 2
MPLTQYRKGRATGPSDLFIATPSGASRPCANYQVSIADTFKHLGQLGIEADYALHGGDCHVDDARNLLVRQFLMSGAPVMLFIDDDVGWSPEDVVKVMRAEGDIVAGAYPLKQDIEDYPVKLLPVDAQQARSDGLLEVAGIGTGFMAIKRHVLVALEEKKKWTRFYGRGFSRDEPPLTVVFERTLVEGHRWSGDLNFCREARAMGFKVFVAPEMHMTHEGHWQWEGHFGNFLRRISGVVDPRLDEGMQRLASGEATPDTFGQLFQGWNSIWSAGPAMLKTCYYRTSILNGGHVLETGSGLTTLAMGVAAIKSGATIWSLEHDFDYMKKTRELLARYKLKAVRLVYAPLKEYGDYAWYDVPDGLPEQFDLVLCDGPPRKYGRDGLFRTMGDRIKEATWIVDDADDPTQLALVNQKAQKAGKTVEVVGNPGMRNYAIAS